MNTTRLGKRTVTLSAPVPTHKLTVAVVFGAVLAIVVALQVVSLPEKTRLWTETFNAGHVLLFGVLAIFSLWTSTRLFADRLHKRHQHYLIALTTTIAIGALTEILQLWAPRDANLADFARNVAGTVCFLSFYGTHDSRLRGEWGSGFKRKFVAAVSVAALFIAFLPLLGWAAAYVHRSYAFPEIVSFESYWSRKFLDTQDADLVITAAPPVWKTVRGRHIARLTLEPARYPGLSVQEPYPDWSGYSFLRFDIYSEMTKSIELVVRVHDRLHNNDYHDRFNQALTVLPGANEFRIPLTNIQAAPVTRGLDLRNIAGLSIFALRPRQPYFIDIDAIWLE